MRDAYIIINVVNTQHKLVAEYERYLHILVMLYMLVTHNISYYKQSIRDTYVHSNAC